MHVIFDVLVVLDFNVNVLVIFDVHVVLVFEWCPQKAAMIRSGENRVSFGKTCAINEIRSENVTRSRNQTRL